MDNIINLEAINNIINGIFLVILSVASNFLPETMSCDTQKTFKKIHYKQGLIIFLIYFSINFSSKDTNINPTIHLVYTLILWLMYMIVTKFNITILVILIFCLLTILINNQYIRYYESINRSDIKKILEYIQKGQIVIVIGTFMYGIYEYTVNYASKTVENYLFSTRKCR